MRVVRWVAVLFLVLEMPVPVYWLVLHGLVAFWRRHTGAAYLSAVIAAWGGGGWLLFHFREPLFHSPISTSQESAAPLMAALPIALGILGIAADVLLLSKVEIALGGRRLVGHAELTGRGELATRGLYAHLRHPRYLGTFAAVFGACLIVDSLWLWRVAAAWTLLALATIALEERELRLRFGPAYVAYAQRVPALLPNPLRWKRE